MTQCHAHRAALADLDAMTYVVIRPAPAADDNDGLGTYTVEAAAHGMSKAAAAYALRQVADRFDADAAAMGDQPLDAAAIAEADARNAPHRATEQQPPASPPILGIVASGQAAQAMARGIRSARRPAGLGALLDHVAANLDDDRTSPVLSTLAEALLDEERAPTPVAAYGAARIVLAEHARQLSAMLRAAAHARCDCCLDQVARLDEYAGQLAPHLTPARPAVDDEHQAAEPAPRFPQLAVPCPRCEAPAGQLCTSHSGTRTRTGDTHQARTAAYRATTAAGR
ncbi:hypothetical protein ACFYWN_12055 [Streptomyces sp. NPDC002917]|uniref:zinc finger domain-containing protein n=1 Tax=Streptomyces sp. NPDC002917 TaxID=3364671 RepID=UPI0036C5850F